MAKKHKNVTDEDIFLMMQGLTPELISVRSQRLLDEYNTFKEKSDIDEDDDDTMLYRSFIGHKLAALYNTVEFLLREIKSINTTMADGFGGIADLLESKEKKKRRNRK